MDKPKITSYRELLAEEERLKLLLQSRRQQVRSDLHAIHTELQPVIRAGTTVKKFLARRGTTAAANLGIRLVVDGLIKRSLLARSGWLMRTVVPVLLKNYASNITAEPDKLVMKIRKVFGMDGKAVRQE